MSKKKELSGEQFGLIVLFIVIIGLLVAVLISSGVISDQRARINYLEQFEPADSDIDWMVEWEKEILEDSQYNFQVMRDLFTPMYNDTVTVEPAGYKSAEYDWENCTKISEGGWMFWVNHTVVLSSYYFENVKSYKVLFPTDGKIELIEVKT